VISPACELGGPEPPASRRSLQNGGQPVMINPAYELAGPGGQERPAPRRGPRNGGQRRNHLRMPGDQT
jgi:hypothetical protein